jgi:cyclopropane-fatty-acyl-phospholipid synthase
VVTATNSREQAAFAARRVQAAGAAERVEVRLSDYRELAGRYDAIVSVEMLEAVGEAYLPTFFAACDRLLAPGGRVGLQAITMPHDRYVASRRTYTWIHKYVFPGGLIPSREAIEGAMRQGSALRVAAVQEIGEHYVPTLRLWRERFVARVDEARALGFDGAFPRMWELYLAYCEAGFATRQLGVAQLALERGA